MSITAVAIHVESGLTKRTADLWNSAAVWLQIAWKPWKT